jgi:DNA polymerase III epsilon subunit family exonuclease
MPPTGSQVGKTRNQPRYRGKFASKTHRAPQSSPAVRVVPGLDDAQGKARPQLPEQGRGATRTAEELLTLDHPAMSSFFDATPRFDDEQRGSLLVDDWARMLRKFDRDGSDPLAPVDPSDWGAWCRAEAQKQRDRGKDVGIAVHYEAMASFPPASQIEAAFLKRRRWQGEEADRAWYRERRQIAGALDISIYDVDSIVDAARQEALTNPSVMQEDPVPRWFSQAIETSYWGRDAIKTPPSDPASRWALYQATSNLERSSGILRDGREFVVFDTETTGLEHTADIVNIAAIVYNSDGREIGRVSELIRPPADENGNISTGSPEAVNVHGITPEMVKDAPTFADLAPQLYEALQGRTLVAHNINFDYPKVQRHMAMVGHKMLSAGPMVDTLRLAKYHYPIPEGKRASDWPRTLKASCEREGMPFDEKLAHGAEYDTEMCARLFMVLRDKQFDS